jgi:hypothetical protein
MKMDLTSINDPEKMRQTVLSLKSKGSRLFIWQNDKKGNRTSIRTNASDIVFSDNLLVFGPELTSNFRVGETLYFYHEPRTVIFRSLIKNLGDGHLKVTYPDKMFLMETRANSRRTFKNKERNISFSKKAYDTVPVRLKGRALDISEKGISLSIPQSGGKNLLIGDTIRIHSIDNHLFGPVLDCTLRYIENISLKGVVELRIGLSFSRLITQSELQSLFS